MPCVLPTTKYMYILPDTSCALYVEYNNTCNIFRTVHRRHGIFYGIAVQHSLLARRGSGLMQYIELFPLQRILQSNQIAERAIRHEIKWRPSKKLILRE